MDSVSKMKVHEKILSLINKIKHGEIEGTYEIVVATVSTLKEVINNTEWKTAQSVMDLVKLNGKHLIEGVPLETCIGNMVRRILHIIREEYSAELKNKTEEAYPQESLHKIITSKNERDIDFNVSVPFLKEALVEHINEFEVELETCYENITQQASDHIHSSEIILTIGRSRLVEEFFKSAAKTRTFEVIVAEGGSDLNGHQMAVNLAKVNIKTTLISDAAIFAMMSRVNKVIVGTHTVMLNGGLKATSGTYTVAQAAKHYYVPVMVLLPLYKLSPEYLCLYEQEGFNKYLSPSQGVIPLDNIQLMDKIRAYNPAFDYVPPELVTLFISNTGGNAPSYIYRLLSELYHPDDYEL